MNYYRCENPDCGFLAEEEPDVCPQCGGTFFLSVDEEELTGPDWVQLGNRAVDEERPTDALACYQQAAALDDMLGVTNLGWCLEAGIGVPADPRQAVVLYAQAAARDCLAEAVERQEAAGYPVAFHIHDEVVIDAPPGRDSLEEVINIMRQVPSWAEGLPLNADGWVNPFFKKD